MSQSLPAMPSKLELLAVQAPLRVWQGSRTVWRISIVDQRTGQLVDVTPTNLLVKAPNGVKFIMPATRQSVGMYEVGMAVFAEGVWRVKYEPTSPYVIASENAFIVDAGGFPGWPDPEPNEELIHIVADDGSTLLFGIDGTMVVEE